MLENHGIVSGDGRRLVELLDRAHVISPHEKHPTEAVHVVAVLRFALERFTDEFSAGRGPSHEREKVAVEIAGRWIIRLLCMERRDILLGFLVALQLLEHARKVENHPLVARPDLRRTRQELEAVSSESTL